MGSGIAQVAAQAGFPTILYELNEPALEKASALLGKNLGMLEQKGRIAPGEKERILGNIRFTSRLEDCIADLYIEAIIEKPEAKIALFHQVAALNKGEYILASNTSSLSIGALAEKLESPQLLAGMHFFNPAPVMKLVEVVRGPGTSQEVIDTLTGLAKKMGKTPVVCTDSPGFIVNRVARPFYIESLRLAEEGLSEPALTDRLLEATGFRMGPFRLMDLIGNDVNYAVSCSVYEQLGRPQRLRPSVLQEEKVKQGKLGRKSGEGYYSYST